MQDNPAIQSLHELASVSEPNIDPSHPEYQSHAQSWRDMTRHMAAKTFSLMEQHKIPHHPTFKAQYDRGVLTSPEYAHHVLMSLYNS